MQRGDSQHKGRGDLENKRMAERDKMQAEIVNSGKCYATRRLNLNCGLQSPERDFNIQPTELVRKTTSYVSYLSAINNT